MKIEIRFTQSKVTRLAAVVKAESAAAAMAWGLYQSIQETGGYVTVLWKCTSRVAHGGSNMGGIEGPSRSKTLREYESLFAKEILRAKQDARLWRQRKEWFAEHKGMDGWLGSVIASDEIARRAYRINDFSTVLRRVEETKAAKAVPA